MRLMIHARALLRLLNPVLCGFCGQVQSPAGSTCRACGRAVSNIGNIGDAVRSNEPH